MASSGIQVRAVYKFCGTDRGYLPAGFLLRYEFAAQNSARNLEVERPDQEFRWEFGCRKSHEIGT